MFIRASQHTSLLLKARVHRHSCDTTHRDLEQATPMLLSLIRPRGWTPVSWFGLRAPLGEADPLDNRNIEVSKYSWGAQIQHSDASVYYQHPPG